MASAWVIDTVDYGLRQSSCRAMWDLRTWYANLRTSVGATEREQQTAARRKYQTATKILSSVPKDFAGWITSWEMATNHALVRKTGGVEDPNTWFEDLTRAIQPIFGGWVTIYAGIYKDKLEEETLTIGEVAKDLRKEAERRDLLGLQEKGSRLTRGVFGPTFATGQSQSMLPQLEATPSNEEGDTQTRNQATGRKRKRAFSPGSPDVVCKACEGAHGLENCYYVFPKKAPAYFKGRKLIRDAVDHRVRNDASLKDEISRIKRVKPVEEMD
ncbi:hypothetical protein CGGC5_v010326 [Colletotrichum fructicola Nara gc5]|uniref:Gag protein n=1 Tax=Colletotrichum fructicola (strain Nara gc5) TaxID=1213859 RepID=A0A7J6IW25_COLFN|nr:hypothetical protein CGGC5_v016806 [Colletotrichum fructicola Nara gc5]KAF4481009.1 hypothetical protein CGGC5_v010326 [Colletotrichum fructicola Nara gc5]